MKLTQLTPMLGVTDIHNTIRFYQEGLGFEVVSKNESGHSDEDRRLEWAHLQSGEVSLWVSLHGGIADSKEQRDGRATLHFYFTSEDVAGLHESLSGKGYPVSGLRTMWYGLTEFDLSDPDGYRLFFSQPTTGEPVS